MIDFIFQVDLSTIYVVLRRDFTSPLDKTGTLTSPVGGVFYYTAASANEAARQYCLREAAKGGDAITSGSADGAGVSVSGHHRSGSGSGTVHGERDGLYRGGCVTREPGRERFEVRVRRLKAKGQGVGGRMVGVEGNNNVDGGERLGIVTEEGEREEEKEKDKEKEKERAEENKRSSAEDGSRHERPRGSRTVSRSSSVFGSGREKRSSSKISKIWDSVRRK